MHEHGAPTTPHWELAVPNSYDAFLGSLSPSTLKSVRRYSRRLEKSFGDRLSFRIFRGASEGDRVFTDLAAVARKTYQHALGVAFAQSEFERRIVRLLMNRGWFRAYVLYLDGEPISFWHGHAYRGAFFIGIPGYDPAYADLRVGNYVLYRLIEDLCADDTIDTLDFGWGEAEYKRRLSTRSRLEQDVHLFAPTAKGCLTNVARSSLLTGVTGVRSLLARAEMIDPIKRQLARPPDLRRLLGRTLQTPIGSQRYPNRRSVDSAVRLSSSTTPFWRSCHRPSVSGGRTSARAMASTSPSSPKKP